MMHLAYAPPDGLPFSHVIRFMTHRGAPTLTASLLLLLALAPVLPRPHRLFFC